MNNEPEYIEGLGQFRAGRGAIVTDWCATKEQATAEYYRLLAISLGWQEVDKGMWSKGIDPDDGIEIFADDARQACEMG